jgi:hypothetical protein
MGLAYLRMDGEEGRRYRQGLRTFPARFSREFGYELKDPFDDLCRKLEEGTAFSFARFGDGEFNAIFGARGANCDGHRYFPDLGQRLRGVLDTKPSYTVGLQPLAVMLFGAERIIAVSPGISWVFAGTLHTALREGRLAQFLDALIGRTVLLVGPEHLRKLSESKGWEHVLVSPQNCWTEYNEITRLLRDAVSGSGDVVLFCASMMSNVLIDDLYNENPANTYIDVGSVFDPLVGVNSRHYHSELDPALLTTPARSAEWWMRRAESPPTRRG